jgi:hypothetical protein
MRETDAERIKELEARVLDLQRELQTYQGEGRRCYNGRIWSETYQRNLECTFLQGNRLFQLIAELQYEERNGIRHKCNGSEKVFVPVSTHLTNVCALVIAVMRHLQDGMLQLIPAPPVQWPKLAAVTEKQTRPDLN